MKEIIYAAPWSKDRKNSWSGTIYYLRESLQKRCTVHDIDTEVFSSRNFSVLAYRAVMKAQKKMKLYKQDMNMRRIRFMDRHINVNADTPILQFEECPGIRKDARQFIYQDLSVAYIENLYEENKALFDVSGFQKNNISVIHKRNAMQREFYAHAAGIFTMSHWLCDWMSGRSGGGMATRSILPAAG